MLRSVLVLFCIALAVQAKTRKGFLPNLFWDKVKHLDVVDVPEDKIIGGTEVCNYLLYNLKKTSTLPHSRRSSACYPISCTEKPILPFCTTIPNSNDRENGTGNSKLIESLLYRIRLLLFEQACI